MPALRQATGSVHDNFCKRSQLTNQVGRCQRGLEVVVLDLRLSCCLLQFGCEVTTRGRSEAAGGRNANSA